MKPAGWASKSLKAIGLAFAAFVIAAIFAVAIRGGAWIVVAIMVGVVGWLFIDRTRSLAGFSPSGTRKVAGAIAALLVLVAVTPREPLPRSRPDQSKTAVAAQDAPPAVTPSQSLAVETPTPTPTPTSTAGGLELLRFDWRKDGFGSILMLDATIRNTGSVAMKDVEISCTLFGKSGTQLGHNAQTIYDVVPAGKTRRFRNVNLGFMNQQADQADCTIVDSQAAA